MYLFYKQQTLYNEQSNFYHTIQQVNKSNYIPDMIAQQGEETYTVQENQVNI